MTSPQKEKLRDTIENMARDFTSVVPRSKSEVRRRIEALLLQTAEDIRKLKKDFVWDNGYCSICDYYSMDSENHHCTSFNAALESAANLVEGKE